MGIWAPCKLCSSEQGRDDLLVKTGRSQLWNSCQLDLQVLFHGNDGRLLVPVDRFLLGGLND